MSEPNWDELPEQFKEPVAKLRRGVGDSAVAAVINGKGLRNWNAQQWGSLFSGVTLVTLVTLLAWGARAYHEYRETLTSVAAHSRAIPSVAQAVTDMVTRIAVIESEHNAMRRELDAVLGRTPSRPVQPRFPRDERFVLEPQQ